MELRFPFKGYHKGASASTQLPNTSPELQNVRSFDSLDNRGRGGQRPGVDKWSTVLVSNSDLASPIVEMVQVTVVS